jgi:hypothetical protein
LTRIIYGKMRMRSNSKREKQKTNTRKACEARCDNTDARWCRSKWRSEAARMAVRNGKSQDRSKSYNAHGIVLGCQLRLESHLFGKRTLDSSSTILWRQHETCSTLGKQTTLSTNLFNIAQAPQHHNIYRKGRAPLPADAERMTERGPADTAAPHECRRAHRRPPKSLMIVDVPAKDTADG